MTSKRTLQLAAALREIEGGDGDHSPTDRISRVGAYYPGSVTQER